MKIAIHDKSRGFSHGWIDYCKKNNIEYKIVDCYSNNIVTDLIDCDGLMWHYHHMNPKDVLFARQLLYAIEISGKTVFPNFNTVWHFDDKVAQKYLLEGLDGPLIPSYVFYEKERALHWIETTSFPKVFKLRRGSGAANVLIADSKIQAKKLIRQSFGRGFSPYNKLGSIKERYYMYKKGKGSIANIIKGVIRLVHTTEFAKIQGNERGYVYFQDFIPDLDHDIRVIVIGDKAIAIKRLVREGDFRASGSGRLQYDKHLFNEEIIKEAFSISRKMKSQSLAIDFIMVEGVPKILEISYGFPEGDFVNDCPGYWDNNLNWHNKNIDTEGWMVENIVQEIESRR